MKSLAPAVTNLQHTLKGIQSSDQEWGPLCLPEGGAPEHPCGNLAETAAGAPGREAGGGQRRGECGLWCVEGKGLVGGVSEGSLQER